MLKGVSLHVRPGETIAFVGPSGGGKTTLCSLLPRFYDVCSGRITVDGKDVRDVTQQSLRQAIGIVQQDVYLFATTFRENIAYGKPEATEEEIIEAARNANIHDFIMSLPQGYDTPVGERGCAFVGRAEAACFDCPCFPEEPADPDFGRGDFCLGQRK